MFVRYETIQTLKDASFSGVRFQLNQNDPLYADAINPSDPNDPTLTKNNE
jgi:hypothetical protein